MIITGVDWSGDGGWSGSSASGQDLLVIAFASIDQIRYEQLRCALGGLRARHGFRPETVFKHSDSSDRVRADFFEGISHTGVEVRLRLIEKSRDWPREFARMTSNQRIASSIASMATTLPAHLIEDSTLLLDLDRKRDGKLCTSTVGAINRAVRAAESQRFRKIKCCPDTDNSFGEIIQVADMVAGAARRSGVIQPTRFTSWQMIVVKE